MGGGRTAVILQRAEHGVGVNLVGRVGKKAATVIAAEVVAERGNRARVISDVAARSASVQDRAAQLHDRGPSNYKIVDATAALVAYVAAQGAVEYLDSSAPMVREVRKATASTFRRIAAEGAVTDMHGCDGP